MALVPATGLQRHHPPLPFRRRPASLRDPGPRPSPLGDPPCKTTRRCRTARQDAALVWHDDLVHASLPPLLSKGFNKVPTKTTARRRRVLALAMLLLIVP